MHARFLRRLVGLALLVAVTLPARAGLIDMVTFTNVDSFGPANNVNNDERMFTYLGPAFTFDHIEFSGDVLANVIVNPVPFNVPPFNVTEGDDLNVRLGFGGATADTILGGPGVLSTTVAATFGGTLNTPAIGTVNPGDVFTFRFFDEPSAGTVFAPLVPDATWSSFKVSFFGENGHLASVPEPGTLLLLGAGALLAGLTGRSRRGRAGPGPRVGTC